jgi:hypothetical protein
MVAGSSTAKDKFFAVRQLLAPAFYVGCHTPMEFFEGICPSAFQMVILGGGFITTAQAGPSSVLKTA